jgi:NADH:ubiquinone oxidoreductase subunit 5 (subunit L)/multisubunit Na+/H+ antiporter MnhA subunit
MTVPLILLATLATLAGFVVFSGVGEALGFVGGIGEVVVSHGEPHEFEIDWIFAGTATATALIGIALGFMYWHGDMKRAVAAREWAPELHQLLARRYYIDELYQAFINYGVLGLSSVIAWFDKRVVNETGVDGGTQFVGFLGHRLKFLQTGRIPNYALGMALGVAVLAIVAIGTT